MNTDNNLEICSAPLIPIEFPKIIEFKNQSYF